MKPTRDVSRYGLNDEGWPGVIAKLSDGWRLVRDRDGKRYHLQWRMVPENGVAVWLATARHKVKSRSALLALAPDVEGLAEVCEGLPESPADALPEFQAALDAASEAFAANDWRRGSYARVIQRDGNVRLVVEPCGRVYRLQWVPTAYSGEARDGWQSICISESLSEIREKIENDVFDIHQSGDVVPCGEILRAMAELPERAGEGHWPALPARPATVSDGRSEAKKARR